MQSLHSVGLGLTKSRRGHIPGQPIENAARAVVLAVLGQSNDSGSNDGTGLAPESLTIHDRVLQWPTVGPFVGDLRPAAERLYHPDYETSDPTVGYAVPMGLSLIEQLGPTDIVIIAPFAAGGSSLQAVAFDGTKRWAPNADLRMTAKTGLTQLRSRLVQDYPDHSVELCFTGNPIEADAIASLTDLTVTADEQRRALKDLFDDISEVSGFSNYLFVKSLMSPSWAKGLVHKRAFDGAQLRLREIMPRCVVLSSPNGPYAAGANDLHFAAPAQALRGRRQADAYETARLRNDVFDRAIDFTDDLDDEPWAAWSLWRRLSADYLGPLFRLRRDGDDAEQDFAPGSDGELDYEAVEQFCAGADGYLERWYDQSGAGRDFVGNGSFPLPQMLFNGRLRWGNGRILAGHGSTGTMILADEPPEGTSIALAGEFSGSGRQAVLSSRNLIVCRKPGEDLRCTSHNAGTPDHAFEIDAAPHVLILQPGESASLPRVDGVRPFTSVPSSEGGTYSGACTLFCRQTQSSSGLQHFSPDLLSEILIGQSLWSETDVLKIEAGMVTQYQTDDRLVDFR